MRSFVFGYKKKQSEYEADNFLKFSVKLGFNRQWSFGQSSGEQYAIISSKSREVPIKYYSNTTDITACGYLLPGGVEVNNCDAVVPTEYKIRFDLLRRIVWIKKENQLIFHISAAELGFPFPVIDISGNSVTTTLDTHWRDDISDIHCQANAEIKLFFKDLQASGLAPYELSQLDSCRTTKGSSSTFFLSNHLFNIKEDTIFEVTHNRESGEVNSGYFIFKEGETFPVLPLLGQRVPLDRFSFKIANQIMSYFFWLSHDTTLNIGDSKCRLTDESYIVGDKYPEDARVSFWIVEDCRLQFGPKKLLLSAFGVIDRSQEIFWGLLAERKQLPVRRFVSGDYVIKTVWVEINTKLRVYDKDSYEILDLPY